MQQRSGSEPMALYGFRSDWETAPRSTPSATMLLAIGDVHGFAGHLDAMLALLQPEIAVAHVRGVASQLVLIGDYIDRGPASLPVLRRIPRLGGELGIPVHALRGNHDQYLIEFLTAERPSYDLLEFWCGNGGDTTLAELGIDEGTMLTSEPATLAAKARGIAGPEIMALLGGLEPHWQVGDYVFVHAGVHPDKSLNEHELEELLWLRQPFLGAHDWPHPFVVVHGHTIRGPEVRPHRIAIDSGCYRTGVLTAVQLLDDRLRFWCVTSDPALEAFHRLPGLGQKRRFGQPEKLREPDSGTARPA
ncbi:metallophosphoesterase [Benzoatithermus flavus]|uniref:Metallophosphoesterase n=1 Tax=Benzoatithermus flavus TaxID=3108223 RepID=A0ABU8XNH9_9PROT